MASQISFFLQWFSIFMCPEPREVQVVEVSSRDVKDCYQAKKSHHFEEGRLEGLVVEPKMQACGCARIEKSHRNQHNSGAGCTDDGIEAV